MKSLGRSCSECGGKGYVSNGDILGGSEECSACSGTGEE